MAKTVKREDPNDPAVQADTIRYMIQQEQGRIAKGRSTWPGLPVSHIPLIWRAAFRPMLASGEVEIVERPRTTRPGNVQYVRFTQTA